MQAPTVARLYPAMQSSKVRRMNVVKKARFKANDGDLENELRKKSVIGGCKYNHAPARRLSFSTIKILIF